MSSFADILTRFQNRLKIDSKEELINFFGLVVLLNEEDLSVLLDGAAEPGKTLAQYFKAIIPKSFASKDDFDDILEEVSHEAADLDSQIDIDPMFNLGTLAQRLQETRSRVIETLFLEEKDLHNNVSYFTGKAYSTKKEHGPSDADLKDEVVVNDEDETPKDIANEGQEEFVRSANPTTYEASPTWSRILRYDPKTPEVSLKDYVAANPRSNSSSKPAASPALVHLNNMQTATAAPPIVESARTPNPKKLIAQAVDWAIEVESNPNKVFVYDWRAEKKQISNPASSTTQHMQQPIMAGSTPQPISRDIDIRKLVDWVIDREEIPNLPRPSFFQQEEEPSQTPAKPKKQFSCCADLGQDLTKSGLEINLAKLKLLFLKIMGSVPEDLPQEKSYIANYKKGNESFEVEVKFKEHPETGEECLYAEQNGLFKVLESESFCGATRAHSNGKH